MRRSHRLRVEHGALRAGWADRVDPDVEGFLDLAPQPWLRWPATDLSVIVPAATVFMKNTDACSFPSDTTTLLASQMSKSS